ncbi:carboxylesterase/lipase family protein [Nocardia tengchongensis]|uniref:carboxylesterase/lipase family protein n=1 Tax=Nocardia tengchongensis TaxID=2055889 RepID=UPI0036AB350E
MRTVAQTKYGLVKGTVEDGLHVFRGVPYAAAPVGPLRYRAPVEPAPWEGEREAVEFGVAAPQHRASGTAGELFSPDGPSGEDCLTLNIWTPDLGATGLPVLVWIHGGGFLFGGGTGSPLVDKGSFARHGVVQVSINYRLGIDGYLLTDDDPASGNFGTADQVAAMRWVRDNIHAFGGDPDTVTIAGNSAGATAVGALLAVPSARGLFKRAIIQSGYSDTLLSRPSAELIAREVYQRAGLVHGDLEALRALRDRDPERVIGIQADLFDEVIATRDVERFGEEIARTGNPFQPVVGGDFLPSTPLQALAQPEFPDVDLLVGYNREEFRLVLGIGMVTLDIDTVAAFFEGVTPGRGTETLALYGATRPDADPAQLLAALETDRLYRGPANRIARAHATTTAATYFYRFSWQSTAFDGNIGAGHAVEQPFAFDALDVPKAKLFTGPNPPQLVADDLHHAWVSFIRTGNPSHDALPAWPEYNTDTQALLDFADAPALIHDPEPAELDLWVPARSKV